MFGSTKLSAALLTRIGDATRAESQAAAERLVAIADLFAERLKQSGECADFAVDTYEAVAAEVAAQLRVSPAMGSSYLRYALAMRERLPHVGKAFEAGDIDYRLFQSIVFRTGLITDDTTLATVDAELAALAPRWPSMTRGKLGTTIDKVVARQDPDAVRRTQDSIPDRYVEINESDPGMADVCARVFNTTGIALGKRLDELTATVCDADPRTSDQRRADAMAALVAGADRLACACGSDTCAAGANSRLPGTVIIHVVAERATLEGRSQTPGFAPGADLLIPAAILRELATAAKHLPIIPPVGDVPEPGYTPSRALADFVRCRDLTCRAPGCDRPAVGCDIDHTVAYDDGGPTHASNLKCLCRLHHLLKTFWGWHDEQLPDGTVIWTLPGGQRHVTTPGSALLFPSLCVPTARLSLADVRRANQRAKRQTKMPRRTHTRAQNRANTIAQERRDNHEHRTQCLARERELYGFPADRNADPPPF